MTSNSLAAGKIGAQKVEGTCKAIALHYTSKGGSAAAESQSRQTGRCRREERSQQCLSSQPPKFSNCRRQWGDNCSETGALTLEKSDKWS